jgi:hypothetical protein
MARERGARREEEPDFFMREEGQNGGRTHLLGFAVQCITDLPYDPRQKGKKRGERIPCFSSVQKESKTSSPNQKGKPEKQTEKENRETCHFLCKREKWKLPQTQRKEKEERERMDVSSKNNKKRVRMVKTLLALYGPFSPWGRVRAF